MNNTAGTKCVEQLMDDDVSAVKVIAQKIFFPYFFFNNRDTEFYIQTDGRLFE